MNNVKTTYVAELQDPVTGDIDTFAAESEHELEQLVDEHIAALLDS